MNASPTTLASYLPRRLLERLASGGAISRPEITQSQAVVLLSDIQRFTALVEGFSAAGRSGLEALTWVLNAYFIELTEVVCAHGGDVLCVAGDAFVCVWPAPDDAALDAALLRATDAARLIQQRLHDREAGRGYRFRTRVGIGIGNLSVAMVGGVGGRWELIASGHAMSDAARAERVCAAGEVAMSRLAWSRLSDVSEEGLEGRSLADGVVGLVTVPSGGAAAAAAAPAPLPAAAALQAGPELVPLLRPHVPPAVLAREVSSDTWLAELRHLTVLMADLPAAASGDADELARMHDSVAVFQQIITRYGGTLRVDVDDKGVMLLAVFGLPPLAHEDDARRAVRAGRALAEALLPLDVRCGIGIASGRAFCGAFGSDLRREFLVRGDVINLASRLMQQGPAQLVCDHATAQLLRGAFELHELPALTIKGRAEPVRAYLPGKDIASAPGELRVPVGREAERRALHELVQGLQASGRSGLVMLSAEAGMGKSTLVAEAQRLARQQGLRVLQGNAGAVEATTAYFAWQPVFRSLLRVAGDGAAEAPLRVAEYMRALPAWERLGALLGDVLGLPLPEDRLSAELAGGARAENTRALLQAVLRHEAAQGPLLLVLEDAHWLDSSSWAMLRALVEAELPGLALVLSSRPLPAGDAADDWARLAALPQARVFSMDMLPPPAMAQLIAERLGVASVPPAVLAFLQQRVDGHPFFCEELIDSLVESGTLRVRDGRCELLHTQDLSLPSSVEGVILSRIDRLSPGQYLCLKVAAVIGLNFSQSAVMATMPAPLPPAELPACLMALGQQNLTVAADGDAWRFRHAITRDVAYELMPDAQRQPIHRAVASWIEQNLSADPASQSALLAHHWSRARDPEKTVHYLELAGQQALRQGAFADALMFFDQALQMHARREVQAGAERLARWERGVGSAHYFLGDMPSSRAHIERAVTLVDRPMPRGNGALALGTLDAAARQLGHRLFPQRLLGRQAARRALLDAAADDYRMLGQIYYIQGEQAGALVYVTLRGVNAGELAGASPALARNLANMGTLCGFMGQPKWARWYGERAIAMAERQGQVTAAAYVWNIMALQEAQLGRWEAAVAATSEALQRVQQIDDYNLESEICSVRATALMLAGDYVRAPQAWQQMAALAQRKGNPQTLCWALLDESETLLVRGDTAQAAAVLDRALALNLPARDGTTRMDRLHATALVRASQGRTAEAAAAALEVVATISEQAPTGYFWVGWAADAVEVLLDLAQAHPQDGERGRWLDAAQAGQRRLARLSGVFRNVRPRVALLRARLHHVNGDARALAELQRALALAREMAMSLDQARAQLLLAQWERGPAAPERLSEARRRFEALGLRVLAQQAQREQEAPG